MRTAQPRTNLDDPGPGLRDNGRRMLTYADLHMIGGPIDNREPAASWCCASPGTCSALGMKTSTPGERAIVRKRS